MKAAVLTPSRFLPHSVRSRLLLVFAVFFASAMALALMGWLGIRDTREALQDFQSHVLPDVTRSLELSQRIAAIAAMAPYVAESTRPFQLQAEAQALLARVDEAEKLAAAMPDERAGELQLQPALVALKASIGELIAVTRQDLFLQEDLREYLYRFSSVLNELPPMAQRETVDAIFRDLMSAIEVSSPEMLATLRGRVVQQTERIPGADPAAARIIHLIRDNLDGPESLFVLRDRQFQLRERKAFLVSRTRAEAERLSERVGAYVQNARLHVEQRGESVTRAVRSGTLGITLLTAICIAVALFGAFVVTRLVGSLIRITQVMSKLAAGDTEQSTPETARRDELGALARAFEVFRDNARAVRRMANEIREQGTLLATVVESMKDGLSVFDAEGRLLTWNRQYPTLLHLPETAIQRGMSIMEIQALLPAQIGDGSGGPALLAEYNTLRQLEAHRFELAFRGGWIVEFRSNPMPGGGFVTLYSDLTERRVVEAQLRQAQKMEVLGQLTGGVAHDFNNLLTAITGNLYLLEQDQYLSDPGRRFAHRALSAAERGATLTQRLLAFARRQMLAPSVVEIDPFIEDLADLIEYSVGQGVTLLLELQVPGLCAWIDRGQLENALLNLAINARDAMPDGGTLRLGSRADGKMVCIDVTDTGHGMDEAVRERIFDPFFTTKAGSGSGLGLSSVYGFIRQSGGDIRLASSPGQGSCFTLLLPLAPPQPTTAMPGDTLPPIAAQSLLLVEDDQDVRNTLVDLLGAAGHTVSAAASAEEALELLANADYSLLLSDVDLGSGMNGVRLMQTVANRYPDLPRLLMSGLPRELLATRFALPESEFLLAKPFSMAQFDIALHELKQRFPRHSP